MNAASPARPIRRVPKPAGPRTAKARSGNPAGSPLVWLFDLDNTLHDCSRHIFERIDSRMSDLMMQWLSLDRAQADILRLDYWQRYGATAAGLERHHGIAATDFIQAAHDFDVAGLVHAEPGLGRKLARLPGRKIILTNAPEAYARAVLRLLGIEHHFEGIWSIDHMRLQGRLRCKPSVAMLRQLLARLRVPAERVVLVDDTFKNLHSARTVGMRTVLCHHPGTPHNARHHGRSPYMDMRVNRVGQLLTMRQLNRLAG